MICLTWLTFVGATAIDLELQGIAGGSIVNADISAQLFATINLMLSPDWAVALSVVVVLLLLTFLITSADSGILIINTLASGGSQNQKGAGHIVIWGGIFAVLIGAVAWAWFGSPALGGVLGMAIVINLTVAGLSGSALPVLLQRLGFDPAVASSAFLTSITDVVGFYVFLGLAAILLL